MKLRVTLLLFCLWQVLPAQQPPLSIDSLKVQWSHHTNDTLRLKSLKSLSQAFRSENIDSALLYAHSMLDLAEEKSNLYYTADACDVLSNIYESAGNLQKSIDLTIRAKEISQQMNDQLGVIYFATNLGSLYMKMGRYFEALQHFDEVKTLGEQIKRPDRMAAALNNMGAVYHYLGDDQTALDFFIKSYELRKDNNLTEKLAYSLNNIGAVYSKYGNYTEALTYHKKALETATDQSDTYSFLVALINLGLDYDFLNRADSSLIYYQKALDEALMQEDQTSRAHVLERMSAVYEKQHQTQKAKALLQEALEISEATGNKYDLAAFSNSLGMMYMAENRLAKALPLLTRALNLATEINAGKVVIDAYKSLSQYYYLTSNPTQAYVYQQFYEKAKDSAYLAETNLKIANLKNQFELNQKLDELELKNLELDSEKKTSHGRLTALYISGIAAVILLILLIYIALLYRKIRYQNHLIGESEKKVNELLVQEKELNKVKSQMISTVNHEFRTPMAIISSNTQLLRDYFEEMDSSIRTETLKYIMGGVDNLLTMLKNFEMLDSKTMLEFNPTAVDLNQLFQKLVNELHTLPEYRSRIVLSNLLNQRKVKVDPMLITHIVRNLLVNALKFSGNKAVELKVEQTPENKIVLHVIDRGIGMSDEDVRRVFEHFHRGANAQAIKGTGVGMSVVKRCVELHSGTIEIKSELKLGTTIGVFLPFGEVNE
ncbi:MAG: tetratricopeptide repeat-containing sensor histidine kinase [Bacteroidales bacterium]|nr:tetratricopeptide repeat-containing sensor histidine kinase [Bacteroidales bacterium]